MIAETTLLPFLKGTMAAVGFGWTVAVIEGSWFAAAVAVPAFVLCTRATLRISRRLRGKRAEGRP